MAKNENVVPIKRVDPNMNFEERRGERDVSLKLTNKIKK